MPTRHPHPHPHLNMNISPAERIIAAGLGLLTAGPLGAVCSPLLLNGCRGKWFPWLIAGVFVAPYLCVVQMQFLGSVSSAMSGNSRPAQVQP